MKLCPPLAINTLKAEKAQQSFLVCFVCNVALQKTLLLSYFWVVYITFVPILLNKVLWILRFYIFFQPSNFHFALLPPTHWSFPRPSGKWRGVQAFLGSHGTGAYTSRKGQSPPKAEHGSNAYTAPRYRKSGCSDPARVGFEPWFICGTVFLFLTHHYVHLLAWMMYLMSF